MREIKGEKREMDGEMYSDQESEKYGMGYFIITLLVIIVGIWMGFYIAFYKLPFSENEKKLIAKFMPFIEYVEHATPEEIQKQVKRIENLGNNGEIELYSRTKDAVEFKLVLKIYPTPLKNDMDRFKIRNVIRRYAVEFNAEEIYNNHGRFVHDINILVLEKFELAKAVEMIHFQWSRRFQDIMERRKISEEELIKAKMDKNITEAVIESMNAQHKKEMLELQLEREKALFRVESEKQLKEKMGE